MRTRLPALALLAALLVLVLPSVASGRGGGGGGFGGGGDGGGGGGDGDGIFALIWLLFQLLRLCVEAPAIGIPLALIVLLVLFFVGRSANRSRTGRVIRKGRKAKRGNRAADAVAHLRQADPAFDLPAFLGRVRAAFHKVQTGWCAHDLGPLRPFVSDGIHERFALQIEEQKALGYRDEMRNISLRFVTIEEATTEGPYDVVTVEIPAKAADYRVSLDDGEHLSGSKESLPFTEYWTFLRRRGAKTKPGAKGLMEGNCPNCGAGVELNQWASCTHCGSFLRSGEFDWVLAEITQASVWSPRGVRTPAGLDEIAARDPALSIQHLEDRASVVYWRVRAAERLGTPDPVRRVADPAFTTGLSSDFARQRHENRRHWSGECAVGSVDTVGFLTGEERDRAVVEMTWQGVPFRLNDDRPVRAGPRTPIRRELFVFERNRDAVSSAEHAVSSAHCPSCGAPETGGETVACGYCGADLADGSRDWVLASIVGKHLPVGQALLAGLCGAREPDEAGAVAERPVPAEAIGYLAMVAAADGTVTRKEHDRILALAGKAGVPDREAEEWIAAGDAHEPAAPNPETAPDLVAAMVGVALADGTISAPEERLIRRAADRAGLPRSAVNRIVSEERRRHYRSARSEIRRAKRR